MRKCTESPAVSATVGASSGNEIVVRARGVYGRHVRLFERDGAYHLDLFKGIETVQVNGRDFFGGQITVGDRITIGEATITVVEASTAARAAPRPKPRPGTRLAAPAPAPAGTQISGHGAGPADHGSRVPEPAARGLSDLPRCSDTRRPRDRADRLSRSRAPAVGMGGGEFSASSGFRPLASTFRENPMLPPRMLQDLRSGERLTRAETVSGVLTLIVEAAGENAGSAGILVREAPRLAARTVLFLEELVQVAGLAFAGMGRAPVEPAAGRSVPEAPAAPAPREADSSLAETVLRQTDDLKKIVETVEREVIDRAMRRVEGNQSRGAQILNISRGSLIAKLKEFGIPDYRYLRRERGRRG